MKRTAITRKWNVVLLSWWKQPNKIGAINSACTCEQIRMTNYKHVVYGQPRIYLMSITRKWCRICGENSAIQIAEESTPFVVCLGENTKMQAISEVENVLKQINVRSGCVWAEEGWRVSLQFENDASWDGDAGYRGRGGWKINVSIKTPARPPPTHTYTRSFGTI